MTSVRRYTVTVTRTITEEATVTFILPLPCGDVNMDEIAASHVPYGGWSRMCPPVVKRTSVVTEDLLVSTPEQGMHRQ